MSPAGSRLAAGFTGTGLLAAAWSVPASPPSSVGGTAGTILVIAVYPGRPARVRVDAPAQLPG